MVGAFRKLSRYADPRLQLDRNNFASCSFLETSKSSAALSFLDLISVQRGKRSNRFFAKTSLPRNIFLSVNLAKRSFAKIEIVRGRCSLVGFSFLAKARRTDRRTFVIPFAFLPRRATCNLYESDIGAPSLRSTIVFPKVFQSFLSVLLPTRE